MWCLYVGSFLLLRLTRVAVAQLVTNLFIYPTPPGPSNNFVADEVWPIGSVQNIQWTTNQTVYSIALFHQSIDPASGQQLETIYCMFSRLWPFATMLTLYIATTSGTGNQDFQWPVQIYNSDLSSSPIYFLWLNPGAKDGFTSHYFNVTNAAVASTSSASSSSSSSTSSSSSSSSSTSSSTPSPTTTPSSSGLPTSGNNDSNSVPTSLKAGIGVGLGLGIPLVLIAGAWIGLKAAKQRKSSWQSNDPSQSATQVTVEKNQWSHDFGPYASVSHEVHEVHADPPPPAELGTERI